MNKFDLFNGLLVAWMIVHLWISRRVTKWKLSNPRGRFTHFDLPNEGRRT